MTERLEHPGRRGPKPGFMPAVNIQRSASSSADPAPAASAQPAAVIRNKDPLQKSRDIKTMPPAELKDYAKQIGVRSRDIEELTIDRLRQNCMLTVASLLAAYTDD